MANNDAIEAKKAMDDIVSAFREHNKVVADGAVVLESYSNTLMQLPTETRKMLGTFNEVLTEVKKQKEVLVEVGQVAVKNQEKIRAELQKTLDAEKNAASKKDAQIKKSFADAEAARAKDMASQQAKTDKEIALYEKQAQKQIEANNKKIQSDAARAEKEIQIENAKNEKILAANAKLEAKWSRTGANSVIPGMGNKIAELKQTENLASAYRQLSAQVSAASLKYQDLIVRGKLATQSQREYNAELAKAKNEFQTLQGKILAADAAVDKWGRTGQRTVSVLRDLVTAFGIQLGVQGLVNLTKAVFDQVKEIQSLDLALRNVTGSQENFYTQQVFLNGIAEKYGLSINEITRQYTNWYVSAKEKLGNGEIQQIFESIANAGANMGLSMEAQNNAFLALEQMMSKGTVQAEELKRQLGNALPGAFEIMVKTMQKLHPEMDITQRKLMDLMKAGKIMSAEVLPEFAKQFEIAYGIEAREKVETLTAKTNRLSSAWTALVRSVNESDTGGLAAFFGFFISRANDLLSILIRINDNWATIYDKADKRGRGLAQGEFDKGMSNYASRTALSSEEKANIRSRVEEINKEIQKATDEGLGLKAGELQAEKNDLVAKLFYSDPANRKKNIERIKSGARESYEVYASEYNKIIAEAKTKASGMNFTDIGDDNREDFIARFKHKEKEALKELMGTQLELIKIGQKALNVSPIKMDGSGNGDDKKKKDKKDLILLNYKETESVYALKVAEENLQKQRQSESMDSKNLSFDAQLELRKQYSQTLIDIVNDESKRELAVLADKYLKETQKNEENFAKNKEINARNIKYGYGDETATLTKQFLENKTALNNRYNNETEKNTKDTYGKLEKIEHDDFLYFKDITDKKKDLEEEYTLAVIKNQTELYQRNAENEKNILSVRQKNFEQYIAWAKTELEVQYAIDLARSPQEKWKTLEENLTAAKAALDKLLADKSPMAEFTKEVNNFISSFTGDFMSDSGFSETFNNFFKMDDAGETFFDKIGKLQDGSKEKWAAYFEVITSAGQEAFNFLSQMTQSNFDNMKQKAEDERNIAITYAGDSTAAKAEIERQYQRELKVIRRKEAKAQQDLAVFNIAINTAQAIMGLWVKPGFPAAIPMAAIVGALGLAQIAMVKSKEIPQLFVGTKNAKEGLAWTQERGRELIFNNRGKLKSLGSDSGPELTKMDSGDQVLTHDESLAYFKLLKDNSISPFSSTLHNPLLKGQTIHVENKGMSDQQVDRIVNTIEKNKNRTTWDRSGIRQWVSDGNNETERMNNRINGIGDSW